MSSCVQVSHPCLCVYLSLPPPCLQCLTGLRLTDPALQKSSMYDYVRDAVPLPALLASPDAVTFVRSCLTPAKGERPTPHTLLQSPWFTAHGISGMGEAKAAVAEWLAHNPPPAS